MWFQIHQFNMAAEFASKLLTIPSKDDFVARHPVMKLNIDDNFKIKKINQMQAHS